MKLINSIKTEIKKLLYPPFVCVSGISMLVLFFTGIAYTDPDLKEHMVAELIITNGIAEKLSNGSITFVDLINAPFGRWFSLFAPSMLVLSFQLIISNENKKGMIYPFLLREKPILYSISKLVSLMLWGGTLVFCCYLIYNAVLFLLFFKYINLQPGILLARLSFYNCNSIEIFLAKKMAASFFYGISICIPGYIAGVLLSDLYSLICLPILITYVYEQLVGMISIKLIEKGHISEANGLGCLFFNNLLNIKFDLEWFKTIFFITGLSVLFVFIENHILKWKRRNAYEV